MNRKLKIAIFSALGLIGGLLFFAVSGAGYLYVSSPTVRKMIRAVAHREITPDQAFPDQSAVTLLVMGADQDRDDYKRVVGKAQRSDTMFVARFDFADQKAAIISIPRDTKISIPGHSGYRKINAALNFGGPDLAMKTVEQFLGVTIDHSAVINFDGFKKEVDLLGGVPIDVNKPLNYDDNWGDLHVHLTPGLHWLNGEQALGFVRIRHQDSDTFRAKRQQQFLKAVKGRLSDPRVWLKAPAIIEGARHALETDLDDNQLICLATFVRSLPPENVVTATLPGFEGPSFVVLYPDKVKEMARDLLDVADAPLTGLGSLEPRDRLVRRGDDGDLVRRSHHKRKAGASSDEDAVSDDSSWEPVHDEFSAPRTNGDGADSSDESGSSEPAESDSDLRKPPDTPKSDSATGDKSDATEKSKSPAESGRGKSKKKAESDVPPAIKITPKPSDAKKPATNQPESKPSASSDGASVSPA